jgi:ribosomal protein S18 acetylase RimI-like enzyme
MPNDNTSHPRTTVYTRRLSVADVDRFKAMRVEAAKESPASRYPTPEEELERSIIEFQKQLIWDSHHYVLGAFDGDELVGTAGLRRERGAKIHHTAILWGVYVASQYRSRGVAKSLVSEILDVADRISEVTQIKLCVHTRNAPARQLYTSSGFEPYGIERNVIRIGEQSFDEELMMLALRPTICARSQ